MIASSLDSFPDLDQAAAPAAVHRGATAASSPRVDDACHPAANANEAAAEGRREERVEATASARRVPAALRQGVIAAFFTFVFYCLILPFCLSSSLRC